MAKKRGKKPDFWNTQGGRALRYTSFVGLFLVFFVLMFNLLPKQPVYSDAVTGHAVNEEAEGKSGFALPLATQFILFGMLAVSVIGLLLFVDRGPPAQQLTRKQQKLEHHVRRAAYAVRAKNKPKAQSLYRSIYKLYHKIEPHSHHCNEAIHVLHKEIKKLK